MIHAENGKLSLEGNGLELMSESTAILYSMTNMGEEDCKKKNLGDDVFSAIVSAALKELYENNEQLAMRCMRKLAARMSGLLTEFEIKDGKDKTS